MAMRITGEVAPEVPVDELEAMFVEPDALEPAFDTSVEHTPDCNRVAFIGETILNRGEERTRIEHKLSMAWVDRYNGYASDSLKKIEALKEQLDFVA